MSKKLWNIKSSLIPNQFCAQSMWRQYLLIPLEVRELHGFPATNKRLKKPRTRAKKKYYQCIRSAKHTHWLAANPTIKVLFVKNKWTTHKLSHILDVRLKNCSQPLSLVKQRLIQLKVSHEPDQCSTPLTFSPSSPSSPSSPCSPLSPFSPY